MSLRRVVLAVATLNLVYFGVEFGVARRVGSVSLFADSIDFLEDAALNTLIALALMWTARSRAKLGMGLAAVLLMPGIATLWAAWTKAHHPVPPAPSALCWTGAGALAVNVCCALLLTAFREHSGSLTRAAFLSARNDTIANVAVLAVGGVTAYTHSGWPDVVIGLGIAAVNADAAHEVWSVAREEHRNAS